MIHEKVIYKTLVKIPGVSDEEAHMTTDSLIHMNNTALREITENMATKADIRDMVTKADIKDMVKADLAALRIEIMSYLKVEIANLETRMMRHQMVHTGVIITSVSALMLLIKFFE